MAREDRLTAPGAPSPAGGAPPTRPVPSALALTVALVISVAPGAAQVVDRTTGCRFQLPADWEGHAARWVGDCRDALADGLGVLRIYDGGRVKSAFYGEMSRGGPVLGVIDVGGGYVAGRFADGRIAETDDRNLIIRAFRVASDAAREASERFHRSGNEASARHYAAVADRLASQID